ncbi:radial spoke head protein 3 homolog B-like [Folsomia candida]|nr:radial spoke head protein 3 homolog B-like [Folsomia candida]
MVKKDPLCQLYLRGLKKCSAGAGTTKVPAKITTKETKSQKKKNKAKMRAPSLLLGKISSQSQTDPYYEVLYEDMEQTVNCTQTELVTDLDFEFLGCAMIRNPKSGDDKETQILPGDLFDFTLHVAPIVISVSSVVVEQALLELMMESELETLLAQQRVYESRRNLELVRLQRLQRRQQDIVNENVRQIQAEKESMEEARKAGEAVSMALFAKHFLNDILSAAMDDARRDGVLTSEAEMGKDADPIMKWITTETGKSQTKNIISRNVLDDIIGFALVKRVPSPTMSMELSALDE